MRILLVEDEAGIVQFLQQGLEEEGYSVTTASDGELGLQLLLNESFDLVLLDWMLPQKTGLEICKSFREKDKKTPIIFLTAKDTVQETIEGLQAGANDYIKKPFSFDELLERIKIHFRNENTDTILTLGNIKINISKHQVTVESQEILFTQREYEYSAFSSSNISNSEKYSSLNDFNMGSSKTVLTFSYCSKIEIQLLKYAPNSFELIAMLLPLVVDLSNGLIINVITSFSNL